MAIEVITKPEHDQVLKELAELKQVVAFLVKSLPSKLKGYKAAAAFTGRSERTLQRLVEQNRIPYQKEGTAVVFDRSDLVKWMEKKTLGPTLGKALNSVAA